MYLVWDVRVCVSLYNLLYSGDKKKKTDFAQSLVYSCIDHKSDLMILHHIS